MKEENEKDIATSKQTQAELFREFAGVKPLVSTGKYYQGPVPQGASIRTFRKTGRTVIKGKRILFKTYTKNKEKERVTPLGVFARQIGVATSVKKKKAFIQDRIKVLRLQNMLEKKRLLNQIQRLKLAKRVGRLKVTGAIPTIPQVRIREPYFNTPEINADVDSMYADIGHGDNMFGEEDYYGGENYYPEDFYGTEFDNDPFIHLGLNPNTNISPLLW